MSFKANIGGFLLKKGANKSIRQRHLTGPQYHKRKFFHFPRHVHLLHRREPAMQAHHPGKQQEWQWHRHLPGDTRRKPDFDFTYEKRADKVLYAWKKRGDLQLYQVGGRPEVFACFRCGYPTKSHLQVVKCDNWDWRMCYRCYVAVVNSGQESHV